MSWERLVQGWGQSVAGSKPPYIFPGDQETLNANTQACNMCSSLSDFMANPSFGNPDDTTLHLGLTPSPYAGDLRNATVFILQLNPGLNVGDFWAEQNSSVRESHQNTLKQIDFDRDFPFMYLDPKLSCHPGFAYWFKKLSPVIHEVKERRGTTFCEALHYTAKRVACLDLLGYHSRKYGVSRRMLNNLPSVNCMKEFAQGELMEKARRGEATIIITRKSNLWNLPEADHVVIYEGADCRSAHLTPDSEGGSAMLERLLV